MTLNQKAWPPQGGVTNILSSLGVTSSSGGGETDKGLAVSCVDSRNFDDGGSAEEFTAEALEALYQAQLKKSQRFHKRNLVIEGSCNYFFWMDKIAYVSHTHNLSLLYLPLDVHLYISRMDRFD